MRPRRPRLVGAPGHERANGSAYAGYTGGGPTTPTAPGRRYGQLSGPGPPPPAARPARDTVAAPWLVRTPRRELTNGQAYDGYAGGGPTAPTAPGYSRVWRPPVSAPGRDGTGE